MTPRTLYDVLRVSRGATPEEIKRTYRRLARDLHPDANPGDPEAGERFKELADAYQVLRDPDRRSEYDSRLDADDSSANGGTGGTGTGPAEGTWGGSDRGDGSWGDGGWGTESDPGAPGGRGDPLIDDLDADATGWGEPGPDSGWGEPAAGWDSAFGPDLGDVSGFGPGSRFDDDLYGVDDLGDPDADLDAGLDDDLGDGLEDLDLELDEELAANGDPWSPADHRTWGEPVDGLDGEGVGPYPGADAGWGEPELVDPDVALDDPFAPATWRDPLRPVDRVTQLLWAGSAIWAAGMVLNTSLARVAEDLRSWIRPAGGDSARAVHTTQALGDLAGSASRMAAVLAVGGLVWFVSGVVLENRWHPLEPHRWWRSTSWPGAARLLRTGLFLGAAWLATALLLVPALADEARAHEAAEAVLADPDPADRRPAVQAQLEAEYRAAEDAAVAGRWRLPGWLGAVVASWVVSGKVPAYTGCTPRRAWWSDSFP